MIRFAVAFLAIMLMSPEVRAAPQDVFHGQWTGEASDGSRVSFELDAAGDGFTVSLHHPLLGLEKTPFVPSARPAVFEERRERGLFSLFTGDESRNLHEGPILWARFEGASFILYRLDIGKDGRMTLDRFRLEPSGGATRMQVEHIENGALAGGDELMLERRP